ncbi:MAG: 1-deoxy-D-xylulose-5-phosphate reductoisomerase [Vulcanimicrobiaceae bacterium]
MNGRRKVAILGSTGSIGTQALEVIAAHADRFEVVGLAAGRNVGLLRDQVARFGPRLATSVADGADALRRVAVESEPDIVLAATDGAIAFDAVFAAVERGTDIAVANKELIVSAGELLMAAAARSGSRILPVDSEHSAIFQCLVGENPQRVAGIVLTASGGPFLRASRAEIEGASLERALAHPTWRMGTKNTIDSATLMNKGLEVIEASRLFAMPGARIHVAVHPQSIAHGFVLFTDGSVKAQLCAPDMRVPIGYALAFPDRLTAEEAEHRDALSALGGKPAAPGLRYDFERPDIDRFPCLRLAYEALAAGGTLPAVLSAANEVAVGAFVEGMMRFGRIQAVIEATMRAVPQREASLEAIRLADREAREAAQIIVASPPDPVVHP